MNHGLDLSQVVWQKSSYSQGQGNNCIEVSKIQDHVAVRDSKVPDGAALIFPQDQWGIFLSGIRGQ